MNIPNLNTLISEAFEVKPATSPKFHDPSKMSAAKMNLKTLITGGNVISTKKEAISPANKSVSTPKFNLDSYQKDYLSPKNNQSIDQQPFPTKGFDGKKQSKKSNSINLASFLKQNPSKSTTNKQANTTIYNSQTGDILLSEIKIATSKNHSTIDQHSPYNKKIIIPSKEPRNFSENMAQIQTPKIKHIDLHGYEQANKHSEKTNEAKQSIYCKPKNQPLLENDIFIKRVSPKRVKHKEDHNEMVFDNKRHFKRKSVYRSRKSSNHTETHDDPTSKLSTKAPSQFSEVRRSFPSQKSHSLIKQTLPDHLEDELKDISSFQHQQRVRQSTEVKIDESHETTGKNRPQSSSVNKEIPLQNKEKADNNTNKSKINHLKTDLKHLKSMDGATYGKFLKTFYLQKKMDQSQAKSTKAASIHVSILKEDLDLPHPQIHSFKHSYEAEAARDEEKRAPPQPEYKHFAINRFSTPKEETRKRESFNIHDLPSESKLLSVRSQDLKLSKSISTPKSTITENLKNEISSKVLSNFLKNNEKKNLNQKKPTIRENKSVQLEDRTAHSIVSKNGSSNNSNQEVTKFDSNISVHFNDKADVLYKMYQKTKNVLEGYKARENSWNAEKSNLLEHIQNLEYKLQIYENSKPGF